jgi:hypothetical protein
VAGVDSAVVSRFARAFDYDPVDHGLPSTTQNLGRGYIEVGRLEVIRLDNDPNFPENGVLDLTMRGGR